MSWSNNKILIVLLIVLSIPSIFALFHPGFFQSDDGEWMIIRFSAFHQALSDGQFPVRYLSRLNNEYGYPVANFLYPGFMYLSEIPKFLRFGFVDSIKIVLGLSMVLSSVFTYLWLSKIFNRKYAFFGALLYLYNPYHLFDIYKRGSVGEILALAVIPFVFWTIEKKDKILLPLGIALLILSHNTLAVLFFPLIIIYMLIRGIFGLKDLITITILGLLLSAFFWIPAIFDLQFTVFSQVKVSDWQNYFVDINLIGLSTIIVFILTLAVFIKEKFRISKNMVATSFFLIGIASIFFASEVSTSFWQIIPTGIVQFPFRFLSLAIVCASYLFAFILSRFKKAPAFFIGIVIIATSLISAKNFMGPAVFFDKGEGFYATNEDTTTVKNEYMPKWAKIIPKDRPEEPVQLIIGNGDLENILTNSKQISFTAKIEEAGFIQINKIYFPGWKLFINNKEENLYYDNVGGLMDVPVSSGENKILLKFGETRVRMLSDLVSLIGILALWIKRKR